MRCDDGRRLREPPAGVALPCPPPRFATDPITALIEKLTDPGDMDAIVDTADVAALDVWTGQLSHPAEVADTTSRASRLPKELSTITPYDPCWEWADAFDAAERGGMLAWSRLDPEAGRTVVVFGPASDVEDPPDAAQWPLLEGRQSGEDYLDALRDSFDFVEDPPTLDQLDIAADGHDPEGP